MSRAARRPSPRRSVATALTVAGSDGSGGAGIQADLRAFAAAGVWGGSVVTAVTVQDTERVHAIRAMPAALVRAQLEALLVDLAPRAVKSGMLASAPIVEAVAAACREARVTRLVVDPVVRSTSGAVLLAASGVRALREELLPLAYVVTPNLAEATLLSGLEVTDVRSAEEASRRILRLGPRAVVVKGGHLPGEPIDVLATRTGSRRFCGARRGAGAHGTGCAFSAALAAHLARGQMLDDAIGAAKRLVDRGLREALHVGNGRAVLGFR
jgi:hydroxymethylpyrimidine/phosphomethylpyrimidine kinase